MTIYQMDQVKEQSIRARLMSLDMAYRAGMGHIAPDFSCIDILTVLYFAVLKLEPENPNWEERDRFILSKGHAAGALYVTLASRGFFPPSWLETYQQFNSKLPGHPDRKSVPGVEHNTGGLGHGLPVAAGIAAGLKQRFKGAGRLPRVYVLLGDGELQEGSNWETILLAPHLKLGNLTAIVDRNRIQQGDFTENTVALGDLEPKWSSFGWQVAKCNGHDHQALQKALDYDASECEVPRVIIAETTKGRGVSFMENSPSWHHRIPSKQEYQQARVELTAALDQGRRLNHG